MSKMPGIFPWHFFCIILQIMKNSARLKKVVINSPQNSTCIEFEFANNCKTTLSRAAGTWANNNGMSDWVRIYPIKTATAIGGRITVK